MLAAEHLAEAEQRLRDAERRANLAHEAASALRGEIKVAAHHGDLTSAGILLGVLGWATELHHAAERARLDAWRAVWLAADAEAAA